MSTSDFVHGLRKDERPACHALAEKLERCTHERPGRSGACANCVVLDLQPWTPALFNFLRANWNSENFGLLRYVPSQTSVEVGKLHTLDLAAFKELVTTDLEGAELTAAVGTIHLALYEWPHLGGEQRWQAQIDALVHCPEGISDTEELLTATVAGDMYTVTPARLQPVRDYSSTIGDRVAPRLISEIHVVRFADAPLEKYRPDMGALPNSALCELALYLDSQTPSASQFFMNVPYEAAA